MNSNLISRFRRFNVLFILLGIYLLFAILASNFIRFDNFLNILLQSSSIAVMALGLSFPILTGGIDLSVGSIAALSGAVSALLVYNEITGTVMALLAGLGIGLVMGSLTGILVVWGRLPPFVASLSIMAVGRGLTLVLTEGKPVSGLPENYRAISRNILDFIPLPIIILLILALLTYFVLNRTRYGHHIYAVGGNVETARLAGIRVKSLMFSVYLISAFSAALAGIMLTARVWSAQPNAATGHELDAIAAVVLGGTSLMGGSGNAWGPVAGAIIIGVIENGLNLMRVSSYIQQIIKGLILILAVMIDMSTRSSNKGRN